MFPGGAGAGAGAGGCVRHDHPVRGGLQHPARLVPLVFLVAVAVGTALLLLPAARRGPAGAPPLVALFTATGSLTGALAVVDTGTYWSPFGQVLVLALIQVGGLGIMTLATLLGLIASRRGIGVRSRLLARAETPTLALGDVRSVLWLVVLATAVVEGAVAAVLIGRFRFGYHEPWDTAAWHGIFHAVSGFTNAGFALYPDNLIRFRTDGWIMLPIAAAILVGALGFPVLAELRRELRQPARWSTHTRLTLFGTAVLLVAGTLALLAMEWTNPATLGGLGGPGKLLAGFFLAVTPRAGFNNIDYAAARPESLLGTDVLMFIGGGSAGTAGGIKVTTFFLLAFAIRAEVRGESDVVVFHRRVGAAVLRQALAVALLGVAAVAAGTLALLLLTEHSLDRVLLEAVSAFATCGLSTGITGTLPPAGQLVLVILMLVGRVGTITVATALALRSRPRQYRLPEERPIVG